MQIPFVDNSRQISPHFLKCNLVHVHLEYAVYLCQHALELLTEFIIRHSHSSEVQQTNIPEINNVDLFAPSQYLLLHCF